METERLFRAYDEAYSEDFGSLSCLEIGCSQCERDVEFVLLLPHEDEYIRSRTGKEVPTKKVNVEGREYRIMPLPCSFMDEGKCTIHTDRPMMCRNYPYYVDPGGGKVKISLDSLCPLAEGLAEDTKRMDSFKRAWKKLADVIGEDFFRNLERSDQLWMHGRESVKPVEDFKSEKRVSHTMDIRLKGMS